MPGRILVVDDDPEMRDLFREILKLDAHEVLTAASLEEAIALHPAESPQVVLADAGLAEGADVLALGGALRKQWPQGEVVYLADTSAPATKRRLERGRIRHFTRPFQIEELRDLVTSLLDRKTFAGR